MISGEDIERKSETLGALADQFDHLYADNYEKLYQLAYRLTGNCEDAEDVVQEAWLNAYRSRAQFQGKSSEYTWLFKITLRCAYRFIKKKAKTSPYRRFSCPIYTVFFGTCLSGTIPACDQTPP